MMALRTATRPAAFTAQRSRALVPRVRAILTRQQASTKTVKRTVSGTSSTTPKKSKGIQLGFTKDNELFVGRMAMLGFAFSLIGELITGKGALAQLGYELFDDKLGTLQIDELVIGLIAFNLIAALLPASGTFVPDEELEARPPGPLQDPRIYPTDVKRFFGISGFGFTKENELFVGRLAMLGFATSLIGELVSGKGALGQLGYEVFDDKLGILQIDELVFGLIVFNLVAALLPASGTFIPDEEVEARPPGPLQDPSISILDWKRFFGVSGFGFTKENELFVGRVAQLGFAASLIGETITGKGPLAQFDIETGISLRDTEFGLAVFILFFLFAAINPGTGKFVNEKK